MNWNEFFYEWILTSLNVASDSVDILILRSIVGRSGSLLLEQVGRVIAGDTMPFEFNRRNGDEKSSRNVIKWFDVTISVQPCVLWRSWFSYSPLADWTTEINHSEATYSSGAANCKIPVFNMISKQCGLGAETARLAPLHSDRAITIDGSFLFESANIYSTPALHGLTKNGLEIECLHGIKSIVGARLTSVRSNRLARVGSVDHLQAKYCDASRALWHFYL